MSNKIIVHVLVQPTGIYVTALHPQVVEKQMYLERRGD